MFCACSYLAGASQALSMLPLSEQFIIQRPPVLSLAVGIDQEDISNGNGESVEVQSMVSLLSLSTISARSFEVLAIDKIGTAAGESQSIDLIISQLCERSLFHEALCVASYNTAFFMSGAGAGSIDPLNAPVSSVTISGDRGLGLFVYLLASRCCACPLDDSMSSRNVPAGVGAHLGLLGHVVQPLAAWSQDEVAKSRYIYQPGSYSGHLWAYLATVLRVVDGPMLGNWGLHRVAAEACLAARPGKKLPEVLVRSYCGDMLTPREGEYGRGDGVGLLRLLYEHGHLLEACELSTRIINDSIDPRNRAIRVEFKTAAESLIPFIYLDALINAVDVVLQGAGASLDKGRSMALSCAVLAKAQDALKNAIEIMVKVNLITAYGK